MKQSTVSVGLHMTLTSSTNMTTKVSDNDNDVKIMQFSVIALQSLPLPT